MALRVGMADAGYTVTYLDKNVYKSVCSTLFCKI